MGVEGLGVEGFRVSCLSTGLRVFAFRGSGFKGSPHPVVESSEASCKTVSLLWGFGFRVQNFGFRVRA